MTELNKKEIHFIPEEKPDGTYEECDYCGIQAFEHIHPPITAPKDFIRPLRQN